MVLRRSAAGIALWVLLVACASNTTTPRASGDPRAIPEVLDFELPLLAGGTMRGADLAGKDVAFWFWAPW